MNSVCRGPIYRRFRRRSSVESAPADPAAAAVLVTAALVEHGTVGPDGLADERLRRPDLGVHSPRRRVHEPPQNLCQKVVELTCRAGVHRGES